MNHLRLLTQFVVCVCLPMVLCAQNDTLRQQTLHDVQVKGKRVRTRLASPVAGVSIMDMELMNDLPHILGNADPLHYAQLLPGVQTTSEYDSGLYIQGCDNQHNYVGIEGVTLYNVSHLFGFFSVFNPTHFKSMRMIRSSATAQSLNRLGGEVDMLMPDTITQQTHGNIAIGPMSSQGTLVVPTGPNAALTLSARVAYLNLLYGRWLRVDEEQVRYGFDDYNLSWQWKPSGSDLLWIDAYYGHDKVGYNDDNYSSDTKLRWYNVMTALHWNHSFKNNSLQQTVYTTHYGNKLTYEEDNLKVGLVSDITDIGYRMKLECGRWHTGLDAVWHSVQPQSPEVQGFFKIDHNKQPRQYATEFSAYSCYDVQLLPRLSADVGLRATHYSQGGKNFFEADPSVVFSYNEPMGGIIRTYFGTKHQNLFRVGFSEVGLPTEFWLSANDSYSPQRSVNVSLSYERYFMDKTLRMEMGVYYKWLKGQLEYSGNIYDFLYSSYELDNMLLEGKGKNYGVNLMVEKRKGRITGWISYAYGRALRHFSDKQYNGWYPANHERPHELNAMASFSLSPRWSFGVTGVFASGTPYTALRQFYVINNNFITEFDEHNANRVPPYMRVDLSANYDFCTKQGHRSVLNLSIYNVSMRNNVIFYRLKVYNNEFYRHPFSFILPFMPSINYYYQF